MREFPCILLPKGDGYCFGVEAGSDNPFIELHGGFKTKTDAAIYRDKLLREYSDYTYAKVVKIETPEA